MGVLINYPLFHADDGNGDPLVGGLLYTYIAGTTTAKSTYTTKAMSTANANPVVLDTRADAIIYGAGLYKLVLKTSDGVTIWSQDNVPLSDSSGDLSYYPDASETDHGTTGFGSSLYDILTALGTSKKAKVYFVHNGTGNTTTYNSATTFDFSTYTNVVFEFGNGAILTPALTSGGAVSTLTFPSPASIIAQPDQQIFSGAGVVRFGKSGEMHFGWWGTKGDCTNAGVGTDDATELQAAIDCARATYDTTALVGSTIKGIRGRIYLSTAILWAGRNAGTDSKWLYAIEDLCVYGKHTSIILDYTGAHGKHLNNVTLIGDAATIPTIGLLLARRNADPTGNSAGQTYMTKVNIQGSYSVAGFVSFSSEELDMNSCRVEVAAGEFAALWTDTGYYCDSAGAWQQLTCPNQDVWSGKITFTDHYIRRSRFSHLKAAPSGAAALIQCLGTAQWIMTDSYLDDTANDMPLIQFHKDPDVVRDGAGQTNPTLDGVTFHGTYTHGVEFKAIAVRPIIQNCKWGTVTGVGGADVYVDGVNLYDAEIETDIFDASTAGSDILDSSILKINTSITAVNGTEGVLMNEIDSRDVTAVDTVGAGEDNLMSLVIGAGKWLPGRDIRIIAAGAITNVANGDKTIKVKLTDSAGAPTTVTFTVLPATNIASPSTWTLCMDLMAVTSILQRGWATLVATTSSFASSDFSMGLDLTTEITVQVTGECAQAADGISQRTMKIIPY